MRAWTWLVSSCCALVVATHVAAQRPAPVAQPADPPGYRELVEEAVGEHRAGHFAEARALFARAHNIYPNARTLKGLGMAEFELRNYRESAQYLEASLASTVKPLTPELRAEAEQLLGRAKRFLGTVRVLVSPPNVQIMVDGATAPFGPDGSVVLTAGDHTFDATAIGYEPSRQVIKVNGGDDQTATFTLVPLPSQPGVSPPPAAAAPPPAAVTAQPAAEIAPAEAKPRGLRLYLGGLLGVAGNQSFEIELAGYTGSVEVEGNLLTSYGFQAGATFFTLPFFDAGAEVRLAWGGFDKDIEVTTPGVTLKDLLGTDDTSELSDSKMLLIDLDLKPRLRFDLSHNQLELYVAVPFGLTIPSFEEDVDANLGWNIGAGAGFNYFFSEHVGLNAELLVVFHNYTANESTVDEDSGETLEGTFSYSTWQPRLGINLVVAP